MTRNALSIVNRLCVFILLGAQALSQTVTVTIDTSSVLGSNENPADIESFLGITYGIASRFKRSSPISYLAPAEAIVNATTFGVACSQTVTAGNPLNYGAYGYGENCLTLDIYRPPNTLANASLPVMVWISGGAFLQGSTSVYPGTGIVARSMELDLPVITVIINYRLAFWGFLGGQEAADNNALNLGLYDQRDALTWVQNYISNFGGDPAKVTVFGSSAGAISIGHHLFTTDSNLFRAVIMGSGTASTLAVRKPNDPAVQAVYDGVVSLVGCNTASDTFACLSTVDEDTLFDAVNTYDPDSLFQLRPWAPIIDGDLIPDDPFTLISEGKFTAKPFITGDVVDEGTRFVVPQAINTTADFLNVVAIVDSPTLTPSPFAQNQTLVSCLETLYPATPAAGSPFGTGNVTFFGDQFKRAAAVIGDVHFHSQRRAFLAATAKKNVPSWSYQLAQLTSTDPSVAWEGVAHETDVPFVFNSYPSTDGDLYTVASYISAYWVAFANNLDPNVSGLPTWNEYGSSKQSLQIEAGATEMIADNFRQAGIEFLTTARAQIYNA
ncbi:Alpha/Beta hydrolase protein [Lentinula aff. lateritia]|uniref:Alpha/Beta hydrolase protein n=1 Tax=Lentinula aff. lateritia TaxID=2804960 RepID=A0ACC1TPF9_9AGAR|nr:Alpha/Beta hydrolase protein [Lentinula aff. lateritia]